jgi:hypothetical protein
VGEGIGSIDAIYGAHPIYATTAVFPGRHRLNNVRKATFFKPDTPEKICLLKKTGMEIILRRENYF